MLLDEKDLHQKGTRVQIIVIAPHTSVPDHYHKKTTEVFHILEGVGTMVLAGKTFHLKLGDTLTCEPGEVHSAQNKSDKPFRYIVFKTHA